MLGDKFSTSTFNIQRVVSSSIIFTSWNVTTMKMLKDAKKKKKILNFNNPLTLFTFD